MKECITTEYFLVPTFNLLVIKSTASQTKSLRNSAALVGYSLLQNMLTTQRSLYSEFLTEHMIGHKHMLRILNKGIPSTFIGSSKQSIAADCKPTIRDKPLARPT
jgi:hypothetical protein